ncbi:MAG: ROK family protein, partial [Actinomycetota bacterium]|nr:ROK family protein [Actinomycetota bacterium]
GGAAEQLQVLAGDPDATHRMTADDFDPPDTFDPDQHLEELDLSRCALAISIESARIDVALIAGHGEAVSAQRIPVAVLAGGSDNADAIFGALADSIDAVLHAVGIEPEDSGVLPGIGMVASGRVDQQGGTVNRAGDRPAVPTFTSALGVWQAYPLQDRLSERYDVGVKLLSPATAVCAGEHWRGAARGRRNVLGMVLGHGIDGALVIDGRFVTGTTGNAGHIGHVCVDPYGPSCACGGRGCLQAVAGGAAIAEWARHHGGDAHVDAAAVAEAARRGDPVALATFRRAGEAIGQAVAGAVTLLDLDIVVLGGPLATAGPVLFDPMTDGYQRFAALSYAAPPRLVPALLGRDGGQVGAAAAVLEPDTYPVG